MGVREREKGGEKRESERSHGVKERDITALCKVLATDSSGIFNMPFTDIYRLGTSTVRLAVYRVGVMC